MRLVRTSAPAVEPVSLDEAKAHLRIDGTDEDALIASLISAAAARLDGRDGVLGRCLITQSWRLTLDGFAPEIELPLPPVQSVDSIVYDAPDGSEQTLASESYRALGLGDAASARLRPTPGLGWPPVATASATVRITLTAGYGPQPADVPEPIRTAIKMHVGHLFEHRESVLIGSGFFLETPQGVDDFLANHRVWSF